MRLLLRANAHRRVDVGAWEVAASPDTHHRERWLWQVRLLIDRNRPSHTPLPQAHRVARSLPGGAVLEVAADPLAVMTTVEVGEPGASSTVDRVQDEVVVLVACGGQVLVESRHLLADRDAMVLAGDDPFSVSVRHPQGSRSRAAVVRLRSAEGRALGWVP